MVEHLLPVTGAEPQDAQVTDDLRVQTLEPYFEHRRLPLLFDPLQDLQAGLGDDLLDAGRVDPAVDDELVEGDPRPLAADWIEPADDHGFGGAVPDEIDL